MMGGGSGNLSRINFHLKVVEIVFPETEAAPLTKTSKDVFWTFIPLSIVKVLVELSCFK